MIVTLLVLSLLQDPDVAERRPALAAEDVRVAGRVLATEPSDEEIALMLDDLRERLDELESLRRIPLANGCFPAPVFRPEDALGRSADRGYANARFVLDDAPALRPAELGELVWWTIPSLARLIRERAVSCVELTDLFLARLVALDEKLECVITLTEERALAQARALDAELAAGRWRGPLHGIPWVAKDLLAVAGHPTTWGARPFEEQVLDRDAAVVARLDAAGAVLIAKVSLGALAWGDVWFGGRTRNPWKLEQGSSGSSAGSAAATVAGCAVFAIGSETYGSIVSPSDRCGASSLRPTFGRVSRDGAMALCWSLDKLGPLCRSVEDAAIVLAAIEGADPRDPSTVARSYDVPQQVDVAGWKVGYLEGTFERGRGDERGRVLAELNALGVELVPVTLPDYPVDAMMTLVLQSEASAAFDDFTRAHRERELVRQERFAWPNAFRAARFLPAVDYVRANRLRTLLIADLERALADVRALVHPSRAGSVLAMTNLSGHPTVVAPCGFRADGTPFSVSFTGKLFDETSILALADAWQRATGYHERHPDL